MVTREPHSVFNPPTRELISIDDLFSRSWHLFTTRFTTLFGIYFLSTLVLGIVGILSHYALLGGTAITVALFIIEAALILILSPWSIGALIIAASAKELLSITESYGRAKRFILPLLWITVLLVGISYLGIILLVVGALIFGIWFSFSPYILINENLHGTKALAQSRSYANGRFWGIFGRLFLLLLVLGAFVGIPFLILTLANYTFFAFAYYLVSLIIMVPFIVTYQYVLYESARTTAISQKKPRRSLYLFMFFVGVAVFAIFSFLNIFIILKDARAQARDSQRYTDMVQIGLALNLYATQHNGAYPLSLPALVPNYLKMTPQAPEPADGTCSEQNNAYTYIGGLGTYTITFCLGQLTGGYIGGKHIMTPDGISNTHLSQ